MYKIWPRPGHTVKDNEPQRIARHIHPIAHGVCAQKTRLLFSAKDVDQRAGVHGINMLGKKAEAFFFEDGRDLLMDSP